MTIVKNLVVMGQQSEYKFTVNEDKAIDLFIDGLHTDTITDTVPVHNHIILQLIVNGLIEAWDVKEVV
jgi:DNA-binding transcriptional regulator YbjK